MLPRTTILLAAICVAAFGIRAEEGAEQTQEVLHVFVFDATSKPAIALATGRYESRKFDKGELAAMMCEECRGKVPPSQIAAKATVPFWEERKGIAYLCPQCGKLVWKVNGKEVSLTGEGRRMSEKDLEAIVQITAELSKLYAPAQEPNAQGDKRNR